MEYRICAGVPEKSATHKGSISCVHFKSKPAPIDRPYMGSRSEILLLVLNSPGTRDIEGQSLGSFLLYVSHLTLCVPFSLYVSHLILCVLLKWHFHGKI